MTFAVVDIHVLDDCTAETVFGKHALHNLDEEGVVAGLDVLVVRLLHQHFGGRYALTAGIAGVAEVFAVCPLLTGETDFVGVDDDNVVATLYVGRVAGFVFAAEKDCDFSAKASECLVGGVNHYPASFYALCVG